VIELDPLIHEAARLRIVAVLADVEAADFNFLLDATALTRGNLSTHMAKLVVAGYVDEKKGYEGRIPRTEYRLAPSGVAAYRAYQRSWAKLTGGR
jgi:DNA-binding transcriptional ArsR family regulator